MFDKRNDLNMALSWRYSLLKKNLIFFIFFCTISYTCAASTHIQAERVEHAPQSELQMFVGESHVISAPGVRRVAIGSGRLVTANVVNDKEVLLFANQPGMTTLSLWKNSLEPEQTRIYILSNEVAKNQREVAEFVASIKGAQAKVVGDKVITEGEDLSDSDQEKITEIAKRYPQVINFTNRIGWEKMILIDVKVVEFPSETLRQLGLEWQLTSEEGSNNLSAGINWTTNKAALQAQPISFLGVNALLLAKLHLLAKSGQASILAQPRLSTRNGSTAVFFAGGEIPYQVTEDRDRRSVIFKPYGVKLEIQPRVDRKGVIRASVETEVSSIDASLETQSGPALRTRRTKAEFNLRDGQTMVLSGFLSREQIRNQQKLPGLGDLPILGALFRSERFQQRETELVVFVTPHITDTDQIDHAQQLQETQEKLEKTFGKQPDATEQKDNTQRE